MKRVGNQTVFLLAIVSLLAVPLSRAEATIHVEMGDAGDLPGTAQKTVGIGSLDSITGELEPEHDIDMFAIMIDDAVAFSAQLFSDELIDTYLFLFDSDGTGVVANDDAPTVPVPLSEIPPTPYTPGLYYLAVSGTYVGEDGDLPMDGDGEFIFDPVELFTSSFAGDTVLPDSGEPVEGWNLAPSVFSNKGPYEIVLTGAEPAVIPESSSFVIWGLIILAVVGLVSVRRRWAITR